MLFRSASSPGSRAPRQSPVSQISVDAPPRGSPLQPGEKRPGLLTPNASLDLPDLSRDLQGLESPMTLKQKRDLLKKSPAVPDSSVDEMCLEAGVTLGSSPSGRTIFLDIPEDTVVPLTPEHPYNSNGDEEDEEDEEDYELGDEDDSDLKPDDEEIGRAHV